ncbi:MAG: LuxR C-terminal-related transcriptional regulator [Chloroflexi bacterium]|nr:LuxR C-terminal-related transcriptional regulator [Chloroflexota bacterium]
MSEPLGIDQLLHTKLMPPHIHSAVIARPALSARLDEGLNKRLTLLNAPTGFGKSTLVSTWLLAQNIPSAWVALDENDNDPVRFWTYVITALRAFDQSLGKAALAALAAAQPPTFQSILTLLIRDLGQISTPSVLVLEDYHAIITAEIHEMVAFLLRHMPEALHLILISRGDPDLPLGLLRARDELVEINAASLRFSLAETASFLRAALPVEMSTSVLERLQERTEGWAAGLRLAVLAFQSKGNAQDAEKVIQSFSGSHRYIADYLIREVFESQPQARQDFLMKTCFMNRLTGSLCDSITGTGGGEAALEQLERENLFIVRLEHGSGRIWYRYSPLFAESIQALARQRLGEAGIQSIFEKASAWYEYQQLFDDAIETALAAKLFERALALVEKFVEIYSLNEMRTLTRWMECIPTSLTLRHPSVCLTYAQVILFTSDRYAPATAARIEPYLRAAEQTWRAQGDDAHVGAVQALRGMMLLWQGEFQKALEYVYHSLDKLPDNEVFWRGISLLNAGVGELYAGRMLSAQNIILEARALLGASQNIHGTLAASGILSEIFYAQGDLELCAQLSQQIMAEAVGDESMLDDQGSARLNLANVAYEQNDLERAGGYAAEAIDLAKRRANELLEAQAMSRLAAIHAARGDAAQAQESLKALAARLQTPLALHEIRAALAQIAIRSGRTEAPGAWLAAAAQQDSLPVQKEREAFNLARLRIAEGRPTEALALLQPHLAFAVENGRVHSQAEALCLEALAQTAAGDLPKSRTALSLALTIGLEKGFRRLFLDEGEPMAILLRDSLPTLSARPLSLYATTLLHLFAPAFVGPDAFSAPATSTMSGLTGPIGSQALVEPLSQQEVRVLRLLVAGLSNTDIARELVVSTNTVKTHVRNIYRKLDITSRDEARVVAKQLKLV